MGLSIAEQETSISIMRDSDICTVYTSDTTVMTKLDKLAESEKAPHWKVKEEHRLQKREAAVERMKEWQDRKRKEKLESDISNGVE